MMSTRPNATTSRRDAGFTLTEVLVALVLLGMVMGAMMTVLVRQQKFYRSATELLDTRSQVRVAVAMLPSELRSLSSSDTRNGPDIYATSDKAIEFRSYVGSSIVCRKTSTTTIVIPPVDVAKGTALTVWDAMPQVGDSILVFDDSTSVGSDDDHWEAYRVANVQTVVPTSANACTAATGYTQAADVAANRMSYQITVDNDAANLISGTIVTGSPIRFFHRRRYELFQPAGSSSWYLGRKDCLTATCGALSVVSGPFAPYSATVANSGLSFIYLKADATTFTPAATAASRAQIAAVQIVARADTKTKVTISGMANVVKRDSLSLNVSLRNTR
jgi:prepilin-type N-terminal cleavage/methylation domain-containing protein